MRTIIIVVLTLITLPLTAQFRYGGQSAVKASFHIDMEKGLGISIGYEHILQSTNHSLLIEGFLEGNRELTIYDNKVTMRSAGFIPSYRYALNVSPKVNIGFALGAFLGWQWSGSLNPIPGTQLKPVTNFTPGGKLSIEAEYILSRHFSLSLGVSEKIVSNAFDNKFCTSIDTGIRYFF